MHQQQHLQVVINVFDICGEALHIKVTLKLGDKGLLRRRGHAHHRKAWTAKDRHRAQDPNFGFFGIRCTGDGSHDIVLKEPLSLHDNGGDDGLLLTAFDTQTQVKALSTGQTLGLYAVQSGRILCIRVGLGVEFFNDQFAVRGRLEFSQQILHSSCIALQRQGHGVITLGEVETNSDRSI